MSTSRRLLSAAAAAVIAASTTACGVITSHQSYGSPPAHTFQPSDTTRTADMFANYGQPDAIYKIPTGEAYIYRHIEARNILGLRAVVKRTDTVVIIEDDIVKGTYTVEVGEGKTWLAPPYFDATHPVPADYLTGEATGFDAGLEVETED